jgi:hypothetical protein
MADLSQFVGGNYPAATVLRDVGGDKYAPLVAVTPSGITASASFTPAAAAYSAGDIIDVAKELAFTFANGAAIPAGSLIRILSSVIKIDVTAVPSGQTSYTGRLYSATPPSAQADNDAWTLASGDLTVYRGPISLGTPVDEGGALYIKSQYIDTDIKLTTSSAWMQLVTNGGFTATAVARQIILYGVML